MKTPQKSTYKILPKQHNDLEDGFEILAPTPQFMSWDTTISEITSHPYFQENEEDSSSINCKYPVRVGNLIVDDFTAYIYGYRPDIAVQKYFAYCFDEFGTIKSYNDLYAHFQQYETYDIVGHKREDQNSMSFFIDDFSFEMTYWHTSNVRSDDEPKYTSFSVTNKREYEHLLENKDYEAVLKIDKTLFFDGDVEIAGDYKYNTNVKRTPPDFRALFGNEKLAWIDHKNNSIGFSDTEFSCVFNLDAVVSFEIQNVLPAKGGGYSYFMVHLQNGRATIFNADCHFFNSYVEDIEKLTGKKVVIAVDSYNY